MFAYFPYVRILCVSKKNEVGEPIELHREPVDLYLKDSPRNTNYIFQFDVHPDCNKIRVQYCYSELYVDVAI